MNTADLDTLMAVIRFGSFAAAARELNLDPSSVSRTVAALEEDLGAAGDVTTSALVPPGAEGKAELWAKEPMVLSGLGAFARTFERVDAGVSCTLLAKDGAKTSKRELVAKLEGPLASLLIGVLTSLAVGVDRSLADALALAGAGDWARSTGGLLTLKLSSLAATLPFALMLLVLLVRPSGLMGEKA